MATPDLPRLPSRSRLLPATGARPCERLVQEAPPSDPQKGPWSHLPVFPEKAPSRAVWLADDLQLPLGTVPECWNLLRSGQAPSLGRHRVWVSLYLPAGAHLDTWQELT